MSWFEMASFVGLGVLSNTVFPMPFEPLLVAFSGGRSAGQLAVICLIGSLCAGTGALVDAGFLGAIRRRVQRRRPAPLVERPAGWRFYLFTAGAALLPIPFTLVRAALLHSRPRPILFASIVAIARYPRYLVTVFAWSALALPDWAGWALAGFSLLAALEWRHASQRRERAVVRTMIAEGSRP